MTAQVLAFVLSSLALTTDPLVRHERLPSTVPGCRQTGTIQLRIAIMPTTTSLSQLLITEIRRVVEQVWKPYGVFVRWLTSPSHAIPANADLVVVVQMQKIPSAPDSLGTVAFGPDGPSRVIYVSASTATSFIRRAQAPHVSDKQVLTLDPVARAIGSLLGFAAAHELGHVLLATKSHTQAGLMVSDFNVDPFSRASERGRLDLEGETRLAWRLAGAVPCGPAERDEG